jgi:hypothetical protein
MRSARIEAYRDEILAICEGRRDITLDELLLALAKFGVVVANVALGRNRRNQPRRSVIRGAHVAGVDKGSRSGQRQARWPSGQAASSSQGAGAWEPRASADQRDPRRASAYSAQAEINRPFKR